MRFYTNSHKYVCGIDLHTKMMYTCIMDEHSQVLVHINLPVNQPDQFLKTIEPYRDDIVVACECTFSWYWIADLCLKHGIEFILGHALYMGAIHGGKVKNDKIDSFKIAKLVKGDTFPLAYVYPPEWRPLRDLLRRRHYLVHIRSEILTHIRIVNYQLNLPTLGSDLSRKNQRVQLAEHFEHPVVRKNIETNIQLLDILDQSIHDIELYVLRHIQGVDRRQLFRLKTVPGIGDIIGLTLMLEIQDIERFDCVQQFASYARLVRGQKESAGKQAGKFHRKIGNPFIKWAMSEAAILFMRESNTAKKYVDKQAKTHGKAKAISILAHKLGRAVYHIWRRQDAFDEAYFWKRLNIQF
ncbi:MAG: IS110 family transposase [Methylotenera sp.]